VADGHIPVLTEAILDGLDPERLAGPGVYVDATAGLGGHAALMGHRLPRGSTVVLNDLDASNLERARGAVEGVGRDLRVECLHGSFASVPGKLADLGLRGELVLADLGFASSQMDDPERGLSFSAEGPLDMRLDRSGGPTAADLVAGLSERELEQILREYGEEPRARMVARKLVAARGERPITTTGQLAELVRAAGVPGGRIHPATRTFQALRIAVNDELGHLDGLLSAVVAAAAAAGGVGPGGWRRARASGWSRSTRWRIGG